MLRSTAAGGARVFEHCEPGAAQAIQPKMQMSGVEIPIKELLAAAATVGGDHQLADGFGGGLWTKSCGAD